MSQRFHQSKATNEGNLRILKGLLAQPTNKKCADCKVNDSRWAAWNLGVFICIRCSGIHRSMGTHISKVKSVDLDTWQPEQVENMQRWSNDLANQYWESKLSDGHVPPDHKIDSFIRSKYDSKRWAISGMKPEEFNSGGAYVVPTPGAPQSSQLASSFNQQSSLLDLNDLGYDLDPTTQAQNIESLFSPPSSIKAGPQSNILPPSSRVDKPAGVVNVAPPPIMRKEPAKKSDIMSLFGKLPPATSSNPPQASNSLFSNSATAPASKSSSADLFDFNSLSITPATTTAAVSTASGSMDSNDSFGDWNSAAVSQPLSISPAQTSKSSTFDSWKSDPISKPVQPTMPSTTLWSQANPAAAAAATASYNMHHQQPLKAPPQKTSARPPSWSNASMHIPPLQTNPASTAIPNFPSFDAWNEPTPKSPKTVIETMPPLSPSSNNRTSAHSKRTSSGPSHNAWGDTSHQWNTPATNTVMPTNAQAFIPAPAPVVSATSSGMGLDHFMNNAWSTPNTEPGSNSTAVLSAVHGPTESHLNAFPLTPAKAQTDPAVKSPMIEEVDVWGGWN